MRLLFILSGWLLGLLMAYLWRWGDEWLRLHFRSSILIHDYDEQIANLWTPPKAGDLVMQTVDGRIVAFRAETMGGRDSVIVALVGEDGRVGEFREVSVPREI